MKYSIFTLTFLLFSISAFAQSRTIPTRNDIEDKYKCDLSDYYATDEAFEKDVNTFKADLDKYAAFHGKLNTVEGLTDVLKLFFKDDQIINKAGVYTFLSSRLDLSDPKSSTLYSRTDKLQTEFGQATAFITPEILAIPESKLNQMIKSSSYLKEFAQFFAKIQRMKEHTLSAPEEKIISSFSSIESAPKDIFNILHGSELPFPSVKDPQGNDFQISHAHYIMAMRSTDRDFRRRVFEAYYKTFYKFKNTFAAIYNATLTARANEARLGKYSGSLESCLFPKAVPVSVYTNLIETAHKNMEPFQRWKEMKKRYMKLDTFQSYDSYLTLFPGLSKKYTVEEGEEIVLKALVPLGKEYTDMLKTAFANRWIDFYETKSKYSNAFSINCFAGVHPNILLNWNGTFQDVLTLAHELGHSMHSCFSEKNQPPEYRQYSSFIAEIASTTNEALLLDYMIKNAATDEEKGFLLEQFLDNATGTYFGQTMLSEFEKTKSENADKGIFYSADELTKLYTDLYEKYQGNKFSLDYVCGWAVIPHFYNFNFYVYQYATSFCTAQAFAELIKTQGQPAIDRYINKFLCAGCSQYPVDIIKNAGVDMTSSVPTEIMMKKVNTYLDELEKILQKRQ